MAKCSSFGRLILPLILTDVVLFFVFAKVPQARSCVLFVSWQRQTRINIMTHRRVVEWSLLLITISHQIYNRVHKTSEGSLALDVQDTVSVCLHQTFLIQETEAFDLT